jgi:hypothetical protein
MIGTSGTKFCIKSKDCNTATHTLAMRKTLVSAGLYILDKRTGGCLNQPYLDSSNLDDSVIARLLSLDADFEEIRKEFILIDTQDGSKDSEIDNFARKNILKTVQFKTPSKARTSIQENQSTNLTETIANLTSLYENKSNKVEIKFQDIDDVSAAFSDVNMRVENMNKVLPSIASVVDNLGESVLTKTDLIYGGLQQMQQIEGTIGKQTELLKAMNMTPTLWCSISELVDMIRKSESNGTHALGALSVKVGETAMKVDTIEKSKEMDKLKSNVFDLLKSWKAIIEGLTVRVNTLETSSASASAVSGQAANPFSALGISGLNGTVPGTSSSTSTNPPSEIAELLNTLTTRIDNVERKSQDKGKDGLVGSVRLSGVTFTCKDDVGAWLDANCDNPGEIPPYGLFADPQLLLHWIWILLSGTTNSSARDMKDRMSIEMSQDKTYAIDSYQHYIPLVFTGKKSSLLNTGGMEKSRLGQVLTFESWDDATGENGLKQQIAEGLSMVKHSLSDLIEETFSNSPEVRAFALGMLHTSSSFIENLGTYMSETYNNFKDVVGNEKSVWGLVTFVVEQIFRKDFGQVRAKTIGAIDANNRTSGIKIIWSSIRCVDVAQQFMAHGIKNAPAVSASYVRLVITHSNMGKVATLIDENKSLKSKISDLQTSVAEIKEIAKSAKRIADQAMSKAGSAQPPKKKKKVTTGEAATGNETGGD